MRVFHRHLSHRHVIVFGGELLVIFISTMTVAHYYRPGDDLRAIASMSAIVTAVCLLCMYYNDLYDLTAVRRTSDIVVRTVQAIGAAAVCVALLHLTPAWSAMADGTFVLAAATCLNGVLIWRVAFNRIAATPSMIERLLIVGTDAAAQCVARHVLAQGDYPYAIVGFIDEDRHRLGESIVNPRIVGTAADIERLVATHDVGRIVVALGDRRGRLPVRELLRAKLRGVRVEDVNTFYERLTGKLLIEDLRPSSLIFSDGFDVSGFTQRSKRGCDLLLAVVGLILAAPVMLLTMIAVWLETGAPVLYRQERVGDHGRVFTLFKFRSMRQDAEQGTPVWARAVDDRITRVGRVMRKARLDELPQLWNVLRGDMSFVGPRPERPFFVAKLGARFSCYDYRHAVKPGLTGWAQVRYRYGASMEDALEKLRYDLYYVKHVSVLFDFTILFDTVKVVLFARGAR
jgi:sugar transferase (PEP-CTERM system associated)